MQKSSRNSLREVFSKKVQKPEESSLIQHKKSHPYARSADEGLNRQAKGKKEDEIEEYIFFSSDDEFYEDSVDWQANENKQLLTSSEISMSKECIDCSIIDDSDENSDDADEESSEGSISQSSPEKRGNLCKFDVEDAIIDDDIKELFYENGYLLMEPFDYSQHEITWRANKLIENTQVALKVRKPSYIERSNSPSLSNSNSTFSFGVNSFQSYTELLVGKPFEGKKVMQLKGKSGDKTFIVTESQFYEFSLKDFISKRRRNHKPLTNQEIAKIARDLCASLFELHLHRICHMDINPANVVYLGPKDKFVFKNFDLAEEIDIKLTPQAEGTGVYRYQPKIFDPNRTRLYTSPSYKKFSQNKKSFLDSDSCNSDDESHRLKEKKCNSCFDPFKHDIFCLGLLILELVTLTYVEKNDLYKLYKKCCVTEIIQLAKKFPFFPFGDYFLKGILFYKGENILAKMLCEEESARVGSLECCWLMGSEHLLLDLLRKPTDFPLKPSISKTQVSSLDKLIYVKSAFEIEGDETFLNSDEGYRKGQGALFWRGNKGEKILIYKGSWVQGLPKGEGTLYYLEKEYQGEFWFGLPHGKMVKKIPKAFYEETKEMHRGFALDCYLGEGIQLEKIQLGLYVLDSNAMATCSLIKKMQSFFSLSFIITKESHHLIEKFSSSLRGPHLHTITLKQIDNTVTKFCPRAPFPFHLSFHIITAQSDRRVKFYFEARAVEFPVKIISEMLHSEHHRFKTILIKIKDTKITDEEFVEIFKLLNEYLHRMNDILQADEFSIDLCMHSCKYITSRGMELLSHIGISNFIRSFRFFDLLISDIFISHLTSKPSNFTSISCFSMKKCTNLSHVGVQYLKSGLLLDSLRTLHLSRSNITDDTLKLLNFASGDCQLEELDLSFCSQITDKGIENLLTYTALARTLSFLSIKACDNITRKSLINICRYLNKRSIRGLNIGRCEKIFQDGGFWDKFYHSPWKIQFPSSDKLNFQRTQLTDEILVNQMDFQHIGAISFMDCDKFTDSALKHLCRHRAFRACHKLNLSATKITNEGLKALAQAESFLHIKQLKLSSCSELTDQGLSLIPTSPIFKLLEVLVLSFTNVSKLTVEAFVKAEEPFKHLTRLDLSYCPAISENYICALVISQKAPRLHYLAIDKVVSGLFFKTLQDYYEERKFELAELRTISMKKTSKLNIDSLKGIKFNAFFPSLYKLDITGTDLQNNIKEFYKISHIEIKLHVDCNSNTYTRFPLLPTISVEYNQEEFFRSGLDDNMRGSFAYSEHNPEVNYSRGGSIVVADEVLRSLADKNDSESIDFTGMKINNDSLSIIFTAKNFSKLKRIELRDNSEITDEAIVHLTQGSLLETLEYVDLSGCIRLTGECLSKIFKSLEKINQLVIGFELDRENEIVTLKVIKEEGRENLIWRLPLLSATYKGIKRLCTSLKSQRGIQHLVITNISFLSFNKNLSTLLISRLLKLIKGSTRNITTVKLGFEVSEQVMKIIVHKLIRQTTPYTLSLLSSSKELEIEKREKDCRISVREETPDNNFEFLLSIISKVLAKNKNLDWNSLRIMSYPTSDQWLGWQTYSLHEMKADSCEFSIFYMYRDQSPDLEVFISLINSVLKYLKQPIQKLSLILKDAQEKSTYKIQRLSEKLKNSFHHLRALELHFEVYQILERDIEGLIQSLKINTNSLENLHMGLHCISLDENTLFQLGAAIADLKSNQKLKALSLCLWSHEIGDKDLETLLAPLAGIGKYLESLALNLESWSPGFKKKGIEFIQNLLGELTSSTKNIRFRLSNEAMDTESLENLCRAISKSALEFKLESLSFVTRSYGKVSGDFIFKFQEELEALKLENCELDML